MREELYIRDGSRLVRVPDDLDLTDLEAVVVLAAEGRAVSDSSHLCDHDDCPGPPNPSQLVLLPGEDPEAEALRMHNMAFEHFAAEGKGGVT